MKRKVTLIVLFFTVLVLLNGCTNKEASNETSKENNDEVELMVSAAISLSDALDEIKTKYEADHNVSLTFNLGSSGKMAQQIQQGAPSDIFISANQDWMDRLEDDGDIDVNSRIDLTGNTIVLITANHSDIDIQSLSDIDEYDFDQIAVGNPESVPAGKYTEQALMKLDLWKDLEDDIILAKDVRQVLTYVETGNADIGFVYESDALSSDKVMITTEAESDMHDPIIYPGAIVEDSDHKEEAKEFLDYMSTDEAQDILEKHGFNK